MFRYLACIQLVDVTHLGDSPSRCKDRGKPLAWPDALHLKKVTDQRALQPTALLAVADPDADTVSGVDIQRLFIQHPIFLPREVAEAVEIVVVGPVE